MITNFEIKITGHENAIIVSVHIFV